MPCYKADKQTSPGCCMLKNRSLYRSDPYILKRSSEVDYFSDLVVDKGMEPCIPSHISDSKLSTLPVPGAKGPVLGPVHLVSVFCDWIK